MPPKIAPRAAAMATRRVGRSFPPNTVEANSRRDHDHERSRESENEQGQAEQTEQPEQNDSEPSQDEFHVSCLRAAGCGVQRGSGRKTEDVGRRRLRPIVPVD
jgi:hypothetical protein